MTNSKRVRDDFSALSATDIASLCSVDVRSVSRWANAGCPRNDDHTYSAPDVIKWRLDRAALKGELDQKQRLLRAQAERIERENDVALGKLVAAEDIIEAWGSIVISARAALLGLGHRLAAQAAHQPPAVVCRLIDDSIRQILTDLAESGENLQK